MTGTAFANGIPTWLVLPVVMAATHREMLLGPDELGPNLETGGAQRRRNFRSMDSSMPDVSNVPGEQSISFRPVDAVIICDHSGLPLLPESGLFPPHGIVINAVRR